jgi:beta-glucanase (GH16 family)
MKKHTFILTLLLSGILFSCTPPPEQGESSSELTRAIESDDYISVEAKSFYASSSEDMVKAKVMKLNNEEWLSYEVSIPQAGRYKVEAVGSAPDGGSVWLEDHIENTDDRTYNITGMMPFEDGAISSSKDGSPLNAGTHKIKLHATGSVFVDQINFSLMQPHTDTPQSFTQSMEGEEWELVWSDEFEGSGLPDSTKWSYNVGDWGWGNNEPQYYTNARTENARLEDGNLVIEARKNDMGSPWTSARLTTQGKESFLYGKVEYRAKVPVGRGTWAAGWLLGDEYKDELSWPYCGEIDVLECVGYEIDDETGDGINHATCHTRAYYFKQGNQIGSQIEVANMDGEFHTYAIEWYPDVIYGLLDGERYYTYDKNANELEWPFFKPKNIILNLAVGGGWGGAQGIDESWDSHKYILDYVRVYQLK